MLLLGAVCLNKGCKEDSLEKNSDKYSLLSKQEFNRYIEGDTQAVKNANPSEAMFFCEYVRDSMTCCISNSCCNSSNDLFRSNFTTTRHWMFAIGCALENRATKRLFNCGQKGTAHQNCSILTYEYSLNYDDDDIDDEYGGTNTRPFANCTLQNYSTSYTCHLTNEPDAQYNVDIPVAVQNLVIDDIENIWNSGFQKCSSSSYYGVLLDVRIKICEKNFESFCVSNNLECFNIYLVVEFEYACCPVGGGGQGQ
ncbi:MAG: hypothetical protein IT267_05570 [Saprospiraceae bacterium]|nr:hypothetical protein [Saprospiraceae bacterium]